MNSFCPILPFLQIANVPLKISKATTFFETSKTYVQLFVWKLSWKIRLWFGDILNAYIMTSSRLATIYSGLKGRQVQIGILYVMEPLGKFSCLDE